jgi:hypothetical protein
VKIGKKDWQADFPLREEVEDHAGKLRVFVITCHEGGLGFTVRAEEEGAEGAGYEYAAYSETSPYSALGRLRQKMYRGLATRHISGQPGGHRMLHDRLSGRIASDGKGGVLLIVDGVSLDIDDLSSILASHEGWGFELQIMDALE